MDRPGWLWFGTGFLALAFGNALGAVQMFRGNVSLVMASVGVMVAGYQLMHYGVHGEGMVSVSIGRDEGDGTTESVLSRVMSAALLVIAVYCIAQGFVIGAQAAVASFTGLDMATTGAFIVGGYMVGHTAVHGVPL